MHNFFLSMALQPAAEGMVVEHHPSNDAHNHKSVEGLGTRKHAFMKQQSPKQETSVSQAMECS